MASIEKRSTKRDGVHFRVRWQLGGSRKEAWQSETFQQKAQALTFKLAVEACGHHWPENWIRGFGWAPSPDKKPAEAAPVLYVIALRPTGEASSSR